MKFITLRSATIDDSNLLFAWRNDPDVIAMRSNNTPDTRVAHDRWMSLMLSDQEVVEMYIAELDGVPIGQGRVERCFKAMSPKMDACLLSYSIDKAYRGQGYGKQLVTLLTAIGKQRYATVSCRIKRTNFPSAAVAMQAGVDAVELF